MSAFNSITTAYAAAISNRRPGVVFASITLKNFCSL